MTIDESLERILKRREVAADLFYVIFLEAFPEVQKYFAGVNLRRQAVLLTMALMVVKNHFTGDYPATGLYLQYLGTKHHDRGIPQDAYPKFRVALLQTLERLLGSDWDPELAAQWQQAIEKATEEMFKGYRKHVTI
jgi:hemoglobin-like flavoprotein